MFTEWAGVSPKKFLQYITVSRARQILEQDDTTLEDATFETGLSGTSRLHDLFLKIEGMTPGEYKNGGSNLRIHYHFSLTPFGKVLIASTPKGICHLSFVEAESRGIQALKDRFPQASFTQSRDGLQEQALQIFTQPDWSQLGQIKLHLKATPFQLKVWEALLRIPLGSLSTYGALARKIQEPKAFRAVGTAIGKNPVAYLIPCHRVIQGSGVLGNYHWGTARKASMIGWEAVRVL